jgi:hypothetical protein
MLGIEHCGGRRPAYLFDRERRFDIDADAGWVSSFRQTVVGHARLGGLAVWDDNSITVAVANPVTRQFPSMT